MGDIEARAAGAPAGPPQLFCAPHLRCVEVAGRLVMLDLSAGVYETTDEVGAAMWAQLTELPADRDIPKLAARYGVPLSVVLSDLNAFAERQLAAGRLVRAPAPRSPVESAPRQRPSVTRALRERAGADRALRKSFAAAYTARVGPAADTAGPRVALARLLDVFRTADGLYPSPEAPLDCLPRSLAMTRFLRTSGWPAQHVIGVALYPFEAHAWVEVDGVALGEDDTYLHRFTVVQRA
ncbi:lasso peptide biosynthesis B2 protein [Mycolicibacterium sp.]|uniref:lasso peptide biosynthesis B2 protein n=1 Tax=Mycolicibacterium sp. TaxID=2320850 RepID=UPI003D0C5232